MTEFILAHETGVRLTFFLGIFAVMAVLELLVPRRALTQPKAGRWVANLGMTIFNTVLLRLVFPVAAVGAAIEAGARGWGLFNRVDLPETLEILLAVLILDFAIWLQHVVVHAVPLLWRLHRMHHADLDYDVTTGARFHPVEILLSMGIKLSVIALLGPAAVAVVIFEVLLNATAMFNHSNVRMPEALDRLLRLFVVTPDMHRVHHSVVDSEANSNFGFNLPWWDRLFGTYLDQPAAGHMAMTIGIHEYRDPGTADRFFGMLLLPFRGKVTDYAINRRSFGPNS